MSGSVVQSILENKLIAILRKIPQDKLIDVAQAMYEGGVRLLEVTFDQKSPNCLQETTDSIRMLSQKFEGKLLVGAGTVLTTEQVEVAKKSGAKYIISPNVDLSVIAATKANDMVSIPGALSPSEAVIAYQNGADFVKLFPAGELGIDYIKAFMGPLGHIPFLAVGGIHEDNVVSFIKAGVCGVGVGSNIARKDLIAGCQYEKIAELASVYVERISNL